MPHGDRVFLTGATGFVGSHILRELLAAGYSVRALTRTATRDDRDLTWIRGDLRNAGAFARALDGCRYLIHGAALYSFAPRDRAEISRVSTWTAPRVCSPLRTLPGWNARC